MSSVCAQRKTCNEVKFGNLRRFALLSGAAILDHPRDFGPAGTTSGGWSRHADAEAPAAERDRVEQRIEGGEIGAEPRRSPD